jgi:hypothetical protein
MPRLGKKLKPSPWESAKNAKHVLLSDLKTIAYIRQYGTIEDMEEVKDVLIKALEEIESLRGDEVCVSA